MNVTAILLSVGVFLAVILLLVIILLVAKKYLVRSPCARLEAKPP